MGIPLVDYLIDEDLFEIDENYVPIDLDKREEKNDTTLHPLENKYVAYKTMKQAYGPLFKQFIHGNIDRKELMKRMDHIE